MSHPNPLPIADLTIQHVLDGRQIDVITPSGYVFRIRKSFAKKQGYAIIGPKPSETKSFAPSIADVRLYLTREY